MMPFTPDQPTPGFKPDAPTPGFKPDNAEPSVGDKLLKLLYNPHPTMTGDDGKEHEVVQGMAPLAIPAASAPAALSGVASFLGKNAATRIGGSALQGVMAKGMSNAEQGQPLTEGAGTAAAIGGGVGALAEGVSALPKLGKWISKGMARMSAPQAEAYVEDPKGVAEMAKMLDDQSRAPELQDKAKEAIDNSRAVLKSKGLGNAQKLRELLTGKNVSVNPDSLSGISQDIDEALASRAPQTSEYVRPKEIELDANTANGIKRSLQRQSEYMPGTILDPVQAAKNAELGAKAAEIRKAIEASGGADVAGLNKEMQEGLLLQQALRKGGKTSPLAFVSSESPDRVAMLARAEQNGAGGLLDFGNKLGAAKTMTAKDVGSGVPTFLGKLGGRLGLRLSNALQGPLEAAASPIAKQALLETLFKPDNK